MVDQRKSPLEFSVEELDRELIARGAQIPEKNDLNSLTGKEPLNGMP